MRLLKLSTERFMRSMWGAAELTWAPAVWASQEVRAALHPTSEGLKEFPTVRELNPPLPGLFSQWPVRILTRHCQELFAAAKHTFGPSDECTKHFNRFPTQESSFPKQNGVCRAKYQVL